MGRLFSAIKQAVLDFAGDDCMSSGAAIAYYTMFSLPPLLVIVFLIAGMTGVSDQKIEQIVTDQLGLPAMPASAAPQGSEVATGEAMLPKDVAGRASQISVGNLGWASQIAGILVLIFSATGVFAQLQYALNRAWEVEPAPEQGAVRGFLLKRIFSLGMIVVIVFLLMVSMVITTTMEEILRALQGTSPGPIATALGIVLHNLATLLVATLLFAAMFKLLPDAEMSWRDVWVGAGATALLFIIGKTLIGGYLEYYDFSASWGSAAASLVALLVWVYYSSLIVLFGAELTQAWATQFGHGIRPAPGAVRKVEEKHYIRERAPNEGTQ